jgi:hypothetical protein
MMKLKFFPIILLIVTLQAQAKVQKYSPLDEVDCIATVVYLEARGESPKHQLAVAKAIKRWSEYNGEHVCKTVTTGSYISHLDAAKLKQIRNLKNDDWITSKMIAQLSYSTYDPSHGATHFWNKRIPHDPKKYEQVTVLGTIKFLKLKVIDEHNG